MTLLPHRSKASGASTLAPILAALLWAAAAPASQAGEPIATTVADYPAEAVEGAQISFTVNHDIAADLGQVQLHVELKNPRQMVLAGRVVPVSGKGSAKVTFDVPRRDAETVIFFAIWYGEVWTRAIVPIMQTADVPILSQADAARLRDQQRAAETWRARMADRLRGGDAVAVFLDDFPGLDREVTAQIIARLKAQRLRVVTLTADELANGYILTPASFRALLLTNAAVYPAEGARALERFLAAGGDLIALNTPGLRTPAVKVGGKWLTHPEMLDLMAAQQPSQMLYDFETGDPKQWAYTSSGGPEAAADFAPAGAGRGGRALHVLVPDYQGWNNFKAPALARYFGSGEELTCLWARGDAATSRLSVEWVEKDGSRWIATIPLTTKWRYYVLPPSEFHYWKDNPSNGRGGPDDHLRPENAASLTVGIAQTHTPMPGGRHEFWVDDIGVAPSPLGDVAGPSRLDVPPLEALTPTYKFHAVTNAAALRVSDKQCLVAPADLSVPTGLMSLHPRPQGTGYGKDRKWRWVPLLEALDRGGEVCGTPAVLVLNRLTRYAGSMIASFALPPAAWRDPRLQDLVAAVARRMHDGYFLFEGGAESYAYFAGESMALGARAINLSRGPEPKRSVRLEVRALAAENDSGGRVIFSRTLPLEDGRAEVRDAVRGLDGSDYRVTCTLLDGRGRALDVLSHPVVVWKPSPRPDFMQVRDGHFWLHGRRWRAHGVNYMPSSGIGIEEGEYFEFWMDPQPYDPVVIERDLHRVRAQGLNCVSIFCYYRSLNSRNLLDCLERCRRHGLMVDLSLRPGTPFDFRWDEVRALIEAYRLAQNDTLFAYDLAWEPSWGNHDARVRWDADWEKWIADRYGSLESAEADWGVPVPRASGKVTGPLDDQLRKDGPHRVMVAAYRRFLDELLAKAHARANGLVKTIDPHHFTSFRMSIAGDPTIDPAWIGYDFRGLARSVDIMEPEGYGRIGEWDKVRDGRFTVDYARCMAPGRPVMWAEFGNTSWDTDRMAPNPEREAWIGGFYRDFYRMADDADCDGTMCWWYPGGFRFGENSDFGITNPDGSWRSVSHAIRDWADRMTRPREARPVYEWLAADRDGAVGGIVGLYASLRERYWHLIAAGRNPGLRPDGFGLDSATAPRTAVGNVPYRPGRNPHKYLDAELDRVEVRNARGEWQAVEDGGSVTVGRGPVAVRVTVGNLGPAKWLAREGDGQVALAVADAAGAPVGLLPIPADVAFEGTATIQGDLPAAGAPRELIFRMLARPDVAFGEAARVRIQPE